MPVYCTFTLDNRETSMLDCLGFGAVPAYSGHGKGRDNPNDGADVGVGPIPPGTYYIIDRQSGGDSDGFATRSGPGLVQPTVTRGSCCGTPMAAT
jgi:hypothetical protein